MHFNDAFQMYALMWRCVRVTLRIKVIRTDEDHLKHGDCVPGYLKTEAVLV